MRPLNAAVWQNGIQTNQCNSEDTSGTAEPGEPFILIRETLFTPHISIGRRTRPETGGAELGLLILKYPHPLFSAGILEFVLTHSQSQS
jgi:hypothetical protein